MCLDQLKLQQCGYLILKRYHKIYQTYFENIFACKTNLITLKIPGNDINFD